MFNPNHQHLYMHLKSLEPVTDPLVAKHFLVKLVEKIGMVPVTLPQSVYVDEPGNEGLTGSINLATSHIAYHNWVNNGLLMVDVYSCRCFSVVDVLDVIDEYWSLDKEEVYVKTVDRADKDNYSWYIWR